MFGILPAQYQFWRGRISPLDTLSSPGELIAFYQVGYGAAFGTGWLLGATHVPLSTIYVGASLVAGVMIVLAFLVIRPQSAKAAKMSTEPKKGKADVILSSGLQYAKLHT